MMLLSLSHEHKLTGRGCGLGFGFDGLRVFRGRFVSSYS